MSASSILSGVKSHIPAIISKKDSKSGANKSEKNNNELKNANSSSGETSKNKSWADKLRRKSSSTLSLFNVTNKGPSRKTSTSPTMETERESSPIAATASITTTSPILNSEEDQERKENCLQRQEFLSLPPLDHHRSNLELSTDLNFLEEIETGAKVVTESLLATAEQLSNSEQDFIFLEESLKKEDVENNSGNISPSVTKCSVNTDYEDIINLDENLSSYEKSLNDEISASLLPSCDLEIDADIKNATGEDLLDKMLSHHLPQSVKLNGALRSQFRSEQNLLESTGTNWTSSPYDFSSELHSLDYNICNKQDKYCLDISTISEMPEEKINASEEHTYDNNKLGEKGVQINKGLQRRPSITEKYKSMQDLRQNLSDCNQPPLSLTASQSNILFETIPEDDVHEFIPSRRDSFNGFSSFHDLREDSDYGNEHSYQSLDWSQYTDQHYSSFRDYYSSFQDLSSKEKPSNKPTDYTGYFSSENDYAVDTVDGLNGDIKEFLNDDYRKLTKKNGSSKIPKRRHTITVQDISDILLHNPQNKENAILERSTSVQTLSDVTQSGGNYKKAEHSSLFAAKSKCVDSQSNTNNHAKAIHTPGKDSKSFTPSLLDRKKGCVGCQRKSDRKSVVRQQSLPGNKNRLKTPDKNEEERKTLTRSNSSPGQQIQRASGNRRNGTVSTRPKTRDADPEENPDMDVKTPHLKVVKLQQEVDQLRRTVKQLSFGMPRDSYRDDTASGPFSLGNIPSMSVDNVWTGSVLSRQDSSLSSTVSDLREENQRLKNELQESRDQADLLEFRILELTEGSDRFSDAEESSNLKDFGSPKSAKRIPKGDERESKVSSPSTPGDLSPPLSIDSGLDLTTEKKSKNATSPCTNKISVVPSGDRNHIENTTMLMQDSLEHEHKDTQSMQSPLLGDKMCPSTSELSSLASRIQESIVNSSIEEEALLEAVHALRTLSNELSGLQSKVSGLSEENNSLQEALTALSEAHETRTEASGTESEINVRKTPSLHSDLSDNESDSASCGSDRLRKESQRHDVTSSSTFQESGIFEGSSCDVTNSATQTDHHEQLEVPQQHSVDLSTAVARLTSIKSVVRDGSFSVKLQEPGELLSLGSEEHLKACEVAALHLKLQRVCEEKEELERCYDELQRSIEEETNRVTGGCRRCHESLEVDKGEARVLREQLHASESARRSLYDEKCELEEAENDARLMVQRLDSQLTAAREMECLLSASLSQEQEISRELHKKIRELQAMQKERCLRESILEKQSLSSVERMATLVLDRDTYASILSFVKNGLLIAQIYRCICENNPGIVVLYDPAVISKHRSEDSFVDMNMVDCALDEAMLDISHSSVNTTSEMDFTNSFVLRGDSSSLLDVEDFLVPSLQDTCLQTEEVKIMGPSEFDTSNGIQATIIPNVTNKSNITVIDIRNSSAIDHNFGNVDMKPAIEMVSKSTMTIEKDLLSQRENYYLEQIETLQIEKMNLRKEQEQDRSDTLSQFKTLEDFIDSLRQELSDSESERALVSCRLEEIKKDGEDRRRELERRMEELRTDLVKSSDLHENEKIALKRDYDARVRDISEDRRRVSDRLKELESHLTSLKNEIEIVGVSMVTDRTTYEGQPSDAPKTSDSHVFSLSCVDTSSDMLDKVRKLVQSESALRKQVSELEKKESAYKMTIEEADKIMHSHVKSYASRIEELEAVNGELTDKMKVLEGSEDRIRMNLKSSSRTEQDARVADLLQQLIDTEKSELEYKSKLWNLEKSEKQLQIKLIEAEKSYQTLKNELRDQEEMVQKMAALQSENATLNQELYKHQEGTRRICEVQQSEHFLRGRVDELEQSEQNVRDELEQIKNYAMQRERKLTEQVKALEEEVITSKSQLEHYSVQETEAKENEIVLRRQLDTLKSKLTESERDLKESSSETINSETQHRSEVSKLRSQLKLANVQLTDLDSVNANMRERLEAADQLRDNLQTQLEERKRRHENDLLQLNLQVSQKESRLMETESQLCELTQMHATQELDMIASSALAPVLRSAHLLANKLKLCEYCESNQQSCLSDFRASLRVLVDVLNGDSQSDNESDDEDIKECRSLQLQPSCESTISDTEDHQKLSLPATTSSFSNYEDISVPIPAPRKKRKSSQKGQGGKFDNVSSNIRGSFRSARKKGNNTTILEELENKVKELEELGAKKEEELKLADGEASELSLKVEEKDAVIVEKESQIFEIRKALSALQEQLLLSIQAHEQTKKSFTDRQGVDVDALKSRVDLLTNQLVCIKEKGVLKDHIIDTLVMQIRALIRSTGMGVILTQIKQMGLRLDLAKQRKEEFIGSEDEFSVADYDIETVCEILKRPIEKIHSSDSGIENSIFLDFQDSVICYNCKNQRENPNSHDRTTEAEVQTDHVKGVNLSTQETQTIVKSYFFNQRSPTRPKRSFIPKLVIKPQFVPVGNTRKNLDATSSNETDLFDEANTVRSSAKRPSSLSRSSSTPVVAQKLSSSNLRLFTQQRNEQKLRNSPSLSNIQRHLPPTPKSLSRTYTTSSSALKKDSFRTRSSQHQMSDARCIKRMVTGSVPLMSPVECSSSQGQQSPSSDNDDIMSTATFDMTDNKSCISIDSNTTIISSSHLENNSVKKSKSTTNATTPKWCPAGGTSLPPPSITSPPCNHPQYKGGCVPKPSDLKITRRVGVDGVVISWSPLDHECVSGFQVVIGGNVVQQVKSPHRTKALITGLPLTTSSTIGLISVGVDGKVSAPAVVTCDRAKIYKGTRKRI